MQRLSWAAAFTVLQSVFLSFVCAQNDNIFINPPAAGSFNDMSSNPVYKLGQKVTVNWEMDYDYAYIYMWQPGKWNSSYLLKDTTSSTSFDWTVTDYNFNINGVNKTSGVAMNTFYFYLYEYEGDGGFTCHYFNISQPTTTTTTATTGSATATPSSTSTTVMAPSTPTTTPHSATDDTTDTNKSKSGLSSSAKIGIGLGVGLGVPILAAVAAGLTYWLRRKRGGIYKAVSINNVDAAAAGSGPGAGARAGAGAGGGAAGYYGQKSAGPQAYSKPAMQETGMPQYTGVHEMGGNEQRYVPELDSTAPSAHGPVEMPGSEVAR